MQQTPHLEAEQLADTHTGQRRDDNVAGLDQVLRELVQVLLAREGDRQPPATDLGRVAKGVGA